LPIFPALERKSHRPANATRRRRKEPAPVLDDQSVLELKKIAAMLTDTMVDNHSGDWDDHDVARAFLTIYAVVRDAR
jgi:hypothetical protein